jgi:TPR repeat protein
MGIGEARNVTKAVEFFTAALTKHADAGFWLGEVLSQSARVTPVSEELLGEGAYDDETVNDNEATASMWPAVSNVDVVFAELSVDFGGMQVNLVEAFQKYALAAQAGNVLAHHRSDPPHLTTQFNGNE